MNEELQNENKENTEVQPAATAPAESVETTEVATPAEATPSEAAAEVAAEAAKPECEEPQIIVQKERGFAHYVGFAMLCVLCICFFFMPGIALTFGVSRIVENLPGAAAWIFSAIFSFVIWLIFKLKIKGFKKSFYWYIGLCVVVLAILVAIEVLTEKVAVFSSIAALLMGAA